MSTKVTNVTAKPIKPKVTLQLELDEQGVEVLRRDYYDTSFKEEELHLRFPSKEWSTKFVEIFSALRNSL